MNEIHLTNPIKRVQIAYKTYQKTGIWSATVQQSRVTQPGELVAVLEKEYSWWHSCMMVHVLSSTGAFWIPFDALEDP